MADSKKKNPSLQDIWLKLGGHDKMLEAIHKQTKATNGRVTEVERKWQNLETSEAAIAAYKANHPVPQTQAEKTQALSAREKAFVAIIMSLIAIISTLAAAGKL